MKINLGVLFGGCSVEHEISVLSALQVIHAVDQERFNIVPIYISKERYWYTGEKLLDLENYKDLESIKRSCTQVVPTGTNGQLSLLRNPPSRIRNNVVANVDIAFPVTHGSFGEDGCLQGLFELYGIPYTGCDVIASALGMDKIRFKEIGKQYALPLVDHLWIYSKDWYSDDKALKDDIRRRIGYPLIVKPSNLGSSIGVTVVQEESEVDNAIDLAASFADRIIVEKLVPNLLEINCAVLGDTDEIACSVCEEPLRTSEFLSFADKYQSKAGKGKGMQSALRRIPADISDELTRTIQDWARKTFLAIGGCGVARIDFLVDRVTEEVFVNEVNTIPGSMAFYLWEPSNITFGALIDRLADLAMKRHRERAKLMRSNPTNILAISSKGGGSKS